MPRRPPIPLWCLILTLAWAVRSAGAASYPISHFDQLRGLVVSAVFQDSEGYIWLATETGLWRGHANGFEPITAPTALGKPFSGPDTWGKQGKCLLEDVNGTLWIGTDFGLIALGVESLQPRSVPDVLKSGNIFCLARDPSGGLWAGTNEGLYHVEIRNGTAVAERLNGTESRRIYSVAAGDSDDLWLGASQALLHLRGGQVQRHMEDRIGEGPVSLLRATDGALWIGLRNEGGLYRMVAGQPQRMTKTHGLLNDDVNAIIQSPSGDIWVGTEDGAFRWTGKKFLAVNRTTGLENTDVHSILADSEGQIWIGTFGGGAYQLRSPDILTYGVDDGLDHTMVTALAHSPQGRLLVGTLRSAGYFDPEALSRERIEPRDNIRAIHVDERERVWIASQHHVWREGETKRFHVPGRIFSLANGPDGDILVGTSGGLHTIHGETIQPVRLPEEIRAPIFAVFNAPSGEVFLGTASGLARRDGQRWSLLERGMIIRSLCQTPDGTLWLGTENALVSWRKDRPGGRQRASLPTCGRVNDLAVDGQGILWAATSDGLIRLRDGKLDHFTLTDGLPSNDLRAVLPASGGILFAGTTQGLARIDTNRLPNHRLPPRVTIQFWSSQRMLGRSQDGIQQIPFSEEDILVRVSNIGWRSSVGTRYQYQLEGRDPNWSDVTSQSLQRFTDLPPGRYTFRARAVNDHGTVSNAPAEFSFTILAPFWRRPAFMAGAGGILLAITLLAIRLRSRRIELAAERRRREAAVHENEKKFHTLADTISAAAFIFRESRLLYANPAAESLVEYTRDELHGMEFWKVIHPDFRELARRRGLARQQGKTVPDRYEVKILTKTGQSRWVDFTAGLIEFGGAPAVLGTAFDITERKLTEDAIRERETRLLLINSIATAISSGMSVEQIIQQTLERISRSFAAFRVAYAVIDEHGHLAVIHSIQPETMANITGMSVDLTSAPRYLEALRRGERVVVEDVLQDNRFKCLKDAFTAGNTRAFLDIALKHCDRLVGLLCFDAADVHAWSNHEVSTLQDVADYLSIALLDAHMQSERRRAELDLHDNVAATQAILTTAPDGIISINHRGVIESFNPAAQHMFGYSLEEVIGKNVTILIAPPDREAHKHGLSNYLSTREPRIIGRTVEFAAVRKDGTVFPIELAVGEVHRDSGPMFTGIVRDLSERNQAEADLRESEARFRTLVEHAPEAILLLDVDSGKLVDANENALKLTGMGREELFRLGPAEISPALQPNGRPSDVAAAEKVRQALRGEAPVFEWMHQSSDGTQIPCEIRLVRLPSANRRLVRASITDISQRLRAEKTLRELATFADENPSPVLRVAADGRILYANSASGGFLEARGCRVGERLPEPWRRKVSEILESQTRREEEIDCAGKTISMMFTPVPDAGYVNLYGRDITQRKRAEEQLRQSQKMEAVGTLASGVAHEFDNLLTAISTYTELAKSTIAEGHQAVRALEKVEEVAKQARGVTVALLTFSHRAVFPKSAVNLSRQLSETARLLGRLLPARIEIVEDIPSSENLWIKADAGQLQQILMNLALNSKDAMPEGGQLHISLKDARGPSDRRTRDPDQSGSNGAAVITLEDTGCGMSEEILSRIFEPFYTTKPRGQGTGLGMSLVHGIVKDLGGEIAVRSQPEQGTHITITLPCIAGPKEPVPEEPSRRIAADRGRIILVVERNEHIRSIITTTLRSRGFDVIPTCDMEQAVGAIHRREHLVGLIIIDLDMTDEAGLVRLQAIHGQSEDLSLVILAGTLSINLGAYGLDHSHLLRKPFQMGQLTTVVDRLLSETGNKEV